MNLVLADTEEFRRVKRKPTKGAQSAPGSSTPALVESEEKRTLGLTIVRGTHIVSCSVDGPPPADPSARLGVSAPGGAGTAPPTMAAGPGISRPAGRGLPVGLSGPAAGVGGPAPPGGFPGFPPGGFPGGGPPGFAGRGGPPGGPRKTFLNMLSSERLLIVGLQLDLLHHPAFRGVHVSSTIKLFLYCSITTDKLVAQGFQPPPGFQPPSGGGRGFPPPGFPGR